MIRFPSNQVYAVALGIMQDGGLPHIGCRCRRCEAAFERRQPPQYAACLAVIDSRGPRPAVWLIDATPDIKYQLDLLAPTIGVHPKRRQRLRQVDGIFITHAHMGHIGGLPQLGPEAMAAAELPLYASRELCRILAATELWSPLLRNLKLTPLPPNQAVELGADLRLTPVPVPHRDEWGAGTFAFHVQGPDKSLLYLPDIDSWDAWPQAHEQLDRVDTALVDASFYSADELGGRPPAAHPLVPQTVSRFSHLSCQLILTHLNHTNPLLDADSVERQHVLAAGVGIAETGQLFPL